MRNHEGLYFRAKGRDGWNKKSWVEGLGDATTYGKLSTARARVTYFGTHNPNGLPVPTIVVLNVIEEKEIDESARVSGVRLRREAEAAATASREKLEELDRLRRQLQDALARIGELEGRA